MAKKNFGKFLALATISGAVAAGVSYFLKYRSFHAELDDDFHDFEGDESFDGTLPHEGESSIRNYVPLGEKKEETLKETAEEAVEAAAQKAKDVAEKAKEALAQTAEEAKEAAAEVKEDLSDSIKKAATTIEEDIE
ncbi:MAG: hypothetical protein HFG70_11490 [Hungatella sp.]|nr:hypothetical protein [Hungatella sp.]